MPLRRYIAEVEGRSRVSRTRTMHAVAVKRLSIAAGTFSIVALATFMSLRFADRGGALDLQVYRDAVLAWRAGQPVYDLRYTNVGLPFTYPPFGMLVLSWTSFVSVGAATVVITALSVAALWLVLRQSSGSAGWIALPLVGAALWLEPVRSTLAFGQVNLVLAAAVVADALVVPARWRGVLSGMAIAVKLTPGVFLVYFLVTRQWRALVMAVASTALSGLLALVAAPSDSWHYWTQLVLQNRAGPPLYAGNQSLSGLLARVLDNSSSTGTLTAVFVVAVVAMSVVATVRVDAEDHVGRLGVIGLMGLLVSPISWSHHWVWAIPVTIWALKPARALAVRLIGSALAVTMYVGPQWLFPHGDDRELTWGPIALVVGDLYSLLAIIMIGAVAIRADHRVVPSAAVGSARAQQADVQPGELTRGAAVVPQTAPHTSSAPRVGA